MEPDRPRASPAPGKAAPMACPMALAALLLAFWLACPPPAQGKISIQPKIVGGNQTSVLTWPSTVALLTHGSSDSLNSQFCGGTLVASRWVVTAAHCTRGKTAAQIDAVTGRSNMNTAIGQRIQVQTITEHPSYNPSTFDSDLALLFLSSASTQPVLGMVAQNDPQGLTVAGTQGITVGWGDLLQGANLGSNTLQQVLVPIISTAQANAAGWYNGAVTANMFAAGFAAGQKDSCQGDSGGPYMVPDGSGGYALAGAVSWGNGCAQAQQPGIYTRLSNFRTWIDSTMSGGGGGGGSSRTVPAQEDFGAAVLASLLVLIGLIRTGAPKPERVVLRRGEPFQNLP